MDAIALLKQDHKSVDDLFAKFAATGPRATKTRQDLVRRMVAELVAHAAIEEQVFYPAVRQMLPELDEQILEGLEEHHIVKWTLSELDGAPADDERYRAKVTVLIEMVRHHVKEEEGEIFPKLRRSLTRAELNQLGDALAEAKKGARATPTPGRRRPRRATSSPARSPRSSTGRETSERPRSPRLTSTAGRRTAVAAASPAGRSSAV